MEKKFKVGDTVMTVTEDKYNGYIGIIVQVGVFIKVKCDNFPYNLFNASIIRSFDEKELVLIESDKGINIQANEIKVCLVCGGELKDKYSEYVGGNIKKCSSCGWC